MPSAPWPSANALSRPAVRWGVFIKPATNMGAWDADTNTPALSSGSGIEGDCYRVSVVGNENLDGNSGWVVGDEAYFDGTVWKKNDPRRPGVSNRQDWLYPTSVHLSTGSRSADTIHFRIITEKAGFRVQDLLVSNGYSKIVEVRQADDNGDFSIVIAWGQLCLFGQSLGSQNESLTSTARLDSYLFGGLLKGFMIKDNAPDATKIFHLVERDMVFNPLVDGQIEGNRSDFINTDIDALWGPHLFLDPESMRTETAIDINVQDRLLWTMPMAIHALCWQLNPNEAFIKNPKLAYLQSVFLEEDDRLLRNRVIPLGHSLPLALDLICRATGYHWFTQPKVDMADPEFKVEEVNFVFFRNGSGVITDLKANRVDQTKTSDETNIDDFTYSQEYALPNVIHGRGALIQREGTFNLVPGWPRKNPIQTGRLKILDEMGTLEVNKTYDKPEQDHPQKKHLVHVYRSWVLNEAADHGDPIKNRPGVDIRANLELLFDRPTRMVRRKFLPCLSRTPIGSGESNQHGPYGVYLEYNDSTTEQPHWIEYPGYWSVMQNQCGITLSPPIPEKFYWSVRRRFSKLSPTAPLLIPSLRVTACIEGDSRLTYTAERRDEAAAGRDIPLHLDLEDRFADRLVKTDGIYKSRWVKNQFPVANFIFPNTFWITGTDISKRLPKGASILMKNAPGANGRYIVSNSYLFGNSTVIEVTVGPPDLSASTVFAAATVAIDTDEADDADALKKFCDEARNAHDGAEVSASANLKGHDHHEYKRGNRVSSVMPRNLTLNNYSAIAVATRFPQIVGINYSFGSGTQNTELILEVPDAERPELMRPRSTVRGDYLE